MHTLAGAFALDAMSEHERARFRRHLEECAACAQEVRELRATAARLGEAVAEEPPAGFRERVLTEIRTTRQQPPAPKPDRRERSRRSAGPPRWLVGAATAAAVIGLALAGVFGGIALNAQNRLATVQERMDQAAGTYRPVGELLATPDVRTAHGEAAIGGGATVVVSQALDKMMFMAAKLPDRPAERDYQVWLMSASGQPRSAGVLPPGTGDTSIMLVGGIGGANRVALTVEPKGGSPTGLPTTAPVLLLAMPA
jgi:anti-sigma-K factor RskA